MSYPQTYEATETFALAADAADPLACFRDRFHIPLLPDRQPAVYLCGHSLGLQPRAVRGLIEQELDAWAAFGVQAHFKERTPWYAYHELLREPLARLVGANPGEVVAMNSLTINLHLMLATFYRPRSQRSLILTDAPTFPSDLYALQSQTLWHGYNPEGSLRVLRPRPGEHVLRWDDVERELTEHGHEIAVVVWNGVNFATGQAYDLQRLTALAQRQGCVVGLDLAHAVGNVPLRLHDWDVDFAVWCSYKYLNAGPGAVGGCFVHERHGDNAALPRLAGWWGNDPATRFQMPPTFSPRSGADGWQVSNPPILAMAPLRAALALFDEAGMPALRAKSVSLTGYLQYLLDQLSSGSLEIITPRAPVQLGCQLSLLVRDRPHELVEGLKSEGIMCDLREPNVLRVAASPLYNSFHDVWRFGSRCKNAVNA